MCHEDHLRNNFTSIYIYEIKNVKKKLAELYNCNMLLTLILIFNQQENFTMYLFRIIIIIIINMINYRIIKYKKIVSIIYCYYCFMNFLICSYYLYWFTGTVNVPISAYL